jgi:hypothetical protein
MTVKFRSLGSWYWCGVNKWPLAVLRCATLVHNSWHIVPVRDKMLRQCCRFRIDLNGNLNLLLRSQIRVSRLSSAQSKTREQVNGERVSHQTGSKNDVDQFTPSATQQKRTSGIVKSGEKQLTNEPFVKNLFLGKFDTVSSYFDDCLSPAQNRRSFQPALNPCKS